MEQLTAESAPQWYPEVKLRSITPDAGELIEEVYRNCWQSEPKEAGVEARRRFLEGRIRSGHLSCLEFADAVIIVTGSRAFTHQLVRHRIASYAQESQRYVSVSDPGYVVVPPRIHSDPQVLEVFVEAMSNAWRDYTTLLALGMRKEDARFVLPNATKSCIYVKTNFRSWRHFLKLRCDKAAQWEIRGVALEILKVLYECAPGVFEDLYEKFVLCDGEGELWTERD